MTSRTRLTVGSLLTIVGGGAFLSTPTVSPAQTNDCRESVRAYCEYAAATSCAGAGATCTYDTRSCQITNIECNSSPLRPS